MEMLMSKILNIKIGKILSSDLSSYHKNAAYMTNAKSYVTESISYPHKCGLAGIQLMQTDKVCLQIVNWGLVCSACLLHYLDQWLPDTHSPLSERQELKILTSKFIASVYIISANIPLVKESHMTKSNTLGDEMYSVEVGVKVIWQRVWILRRATIGNDNKFY